jgi:hypothetical protein
MSLSPSLITIVEHIRYKKGRCLEVNILLAKINGIKDAKSSRKKDFSKMWWESQAANFGSVPKSPIARWYFLV